MIGLVLWAILIIFIAECACPGLIFAVLGAMAAFWAIYAGVIYLVNKLKRRW